MKYQSKNEFEKANVFGTGEANVAYAKYFIGNSFLNPLTDTNKTSLHISNVTFEPGCKNNWHIHHASNGGGQILICPAGEGWYQEDGKKAVSLKEGTVITIPAEVKHWHGAKGNMNMGNDKEFLIKVVTQCVPYIGYPRSLNAIGCINKASEM